MTEEMSDHDVFWLNAEKKAVNFLNAIHTGNACMLDIRQDN